MALTFFSSDIRYPRFERETRTVGKSSPNIIVTNRRRFSDNEDLLRYLYQDITRLSQVASPYMCLRMADRHSTVLRGIDEAQARMEALKEATGGTLFMDVEKLSANRKFGVVFGIMRAKSPGMQNLAIRFCGVWRFVDGIVVEHSESLTGSPERLERWLWNAKYSVGNGTA